jgi:hypothetical protein
MKPPLTALLRSPTRRSNTPRSVPRVLLKSTQIYEFVEGGVVGR